MTMQRLCFALPLTLATPAAVILSVTNRCNNHYIQFLNCTKNNPIWLYIALLSVALWLGQFFATTYYAWKNQDFIMANEAVLFWVPAYEGEVITVHMLTMILIFIMLNEIGCCWTVLFGLHNDKN